VAKRLQNTGVNLAVDILFRDQLVSANLVQTLQGLPLPPRYHIIMNTGTQGSGLKQIASRIQENSPPLETQLSTQIYFPVALFCFISLLPDVYFLGPLQILLWNRP
jgi:hypothetical protein